MREPGDEGRPAPAEVCRCRDAAETLSCSASWFWLPPARPRGRGPPPAVRPSTGWPASPRPMRSTTPDITPDCGKPNGSTARPWTRPSAGPASPRNSSARRSPSGFAEKSWASSPPTRTSTSTGSRPPNRRFLATPPGSSSSRGFPTRSRAARGSTGSAAGASTPSSTGSTPASRRSTGSSNGRPGPTTSRPPSGWPCGRHSPTSSPTSSTPRPSSPRIRTPGWPRSRRPSLRPSSSKGSRPCWRATRDSRKSITTSARPRSWAESS
ncbi:MAG: hypothetical protein MZV64_63900 [Ignavibacteriales bacterium]|nr:hypothetical protein [Ignavibacteriales bacterium]